MTIFSSLRTLALPLLLPALFLGGCAVDAGEESSSEDELKAVSLPNTTMTKYTTVFGIPNEMAAPKVGKASATVIGASTGDKISAGVTCFNLPQDSTIVATLARISADGKTTTPISKMTLTYLKNTFSSPTYSVKASDRIALVLTAPKPISSPPSCRASVDGVSSGVSEGFVKKLKSTYDQITEENTDTDSPDFHASSQSILKGLGKRQYNYLNAVWGSDYPPTVYTWKVDGQTVVMIAEDNDGGGERHFYTNDGKWLVSGGHSESESFSWYQ